MPPLTENEQIQKDFLHDFSRKERVKCGQCGESHWRCLEALQFYEKRVLVCKNCLAKLAERDVWVPVYQDPDIAKKR